MLRTFGEVVQGAAELWNALPTSSWSPDGRRDAAAVTRLDTVAQGMHRTQLRTGWPGAGPTDERLLQVSEAFTRAADLVRRHHRQARQMRPQVRADTDAARIRIMHTLYVLAHAVTLSVREHVRDEQAATLGVRNQRLTRAIPRGLDAIHRLAAFEHLAGGYLAGRYPTASHGEVVKPPDGLGRLQEALLVWDIQAHRTMAAHPTPANLMAVSRTQGALVSEAIAVLSAGASTGHLLPGVAQRLLPAMEASQTSWARLASRWTELLTPQTRRTDRTLVAAAAELGAALHEITRDKAARATPDVIAARVDLTVAAHTMALGLTAAVDLAFAIRDMAAHDQSLTGPARVLARRATAGTGARAAARSHPGTDAAVIDAGDILANRMILLPETVRCTLIEVANATIEAATHLTSAGSSLGRSTPRIGGVDSAGSRPDGRLQERHLQTTWSVSAPALGP